MKDSELLAYLKLQMAINHPSIEECYAAGYEAAVMGQEERNNPYQPDSKQHFHWEEGFWDGLSGEAPLFTDTSADEDTVMPANDSAYEADHSSFLINFLKITGALAATVLVGYQVFELVA